MKDANLKAIEELEYINYIINHILKYEDVDGEIPEVIIYRKAYNNACATISGYIDRAIINIKSEVML